MKTVKTMKTFTTMKTFGMMTRSIRTIGAAIVCAAALAACSSEDNVIEEQPVKPTEPQVYTMTVQATKATGDDAANSRTTRGLSLDGKTLNVKWNEGEKVYVGQWSSDGSSFETLGYLTAQASSNGTTTLTGTLTKAPNHSYGLWFFLHNTDFDYTGQKGVLLNTDDAVNSIEQKYDFASKEMDTKYFTVSGYEISLKDGVSVDFYSAQAIVKFSLVNAVTGNPLSAKSLTIAGVRHPSSDDIDNICLTVTNHLQSSTCGDLTVTPSSSVSDIYVAIRPDYTPTSGYSFTRFTLTATDDSDDKYVYDKENVTFEKGKYYEVKVKVRKENYSYKMAAAAEASDMGKLICTDGHIHAYGEDPLCKKDRVAKIFYVGSSTGNTTYTHGLALALTDESGTYNFTAANTVCSEKDTSLPVTAASWMLASQGQWDTMISAAGSYTALRDGFSSISGASDLKQNTNQDYNDPNKYWSSTEEGETYRAWAYLFGSGKWDDYQTSGDFLVRACLAF